MKMIYKAALQAIATLSLLFSVTVQAKDRFRMPDFDKHQLDNGLTVYLMEQHEVPLIDVNVVVKTGAIYDGEQSGLAALTLAGLELGTVNQNKVEVEEALDFIGAEVDTTIGAEMSRIEGSFAGKDQQQVLRIIRDMVISPRFDKDEFDKYRSRYQLQLAQQKESPRRVINSYFNKMIYGEQGYGKPTQGDSDSVSKLKLADLKAFHKHWYQPQNTAVIVVGDFNKKAMLKQIKSLFGQWKKATLPTAKAPTAAKDFTQSQVLLVNKSDAMESTFLIGAKGITRSNSDYVAVSVINTILGGRFTSWLNDELRVNAGLTYGARSRFNTHSLGGSFVISTFTKTETTVDAIDLALKTYQRLWQKGIDQKTLDSAKAYVKGQFPPRYETSSQLAKLLGEMFVYRFNQDFINNFEANVNQLTVAKAQTIVNKHFPKDNLQFVIVGKADAIRDQVKKYGKVKQVDIKSVGF